MNELITLSPEQTTQLATLNRNLATLGQAADTAYVKSVFSLYLDEKSANTQRTHLSALNAFSQFIGMGSGELFQTVPKAWNGVTAGLVEAFKKYQRDNGVAPSTINMRLSAIKTYVKLAMNGKVVSTEEATRIRAISGYDRKSVSNINAKRKDAGLDELGNRDKEVFYQRNGKTIKRVGVKKSEHASITSEQARTLATDYDLGTGQGSRDALLMSIALQHGLRCSELEGLEVGNIRKEKGKWQMRFFRNKVAGTDREYGDHVLTPDTVKAWEAYQPHAPKEGKLFRGSRKGGHLTEGAMSQRAITKRVNRLGEKKVGIQNLSAHDCRHYCATDMAPRYTIPQLMDWFGWTTPSMAIRYIEASKVQERDKG